MHTFAGQFHNVLFYVHCRLWQNVPLDVDVGEALKPHFQRHNMRGRVDGWLNGTWAEELGKAKIVGTKIHKIQTKI